jgi:outer membrane lipoprotein LolB
MTTSRSIKIGLLIIFTAFTLSACKTAPNKPTDTLPVNYQSLPNEEKLLYFKHWEITGKIAIITPKERQSAYLNWSQLDEKTEFRLTNLLGVSLLELNANEHGASLESDGKTLTDTSKERLIYRTTGWLLPLDNLVSWIKGAVNEQDVVELNKTGLPARLVPTCFRCAGWEISYNNYKKNEGLWLPYAITVSNAEKQTTLKFKVNNWKRL